MRKCSISQLCFCFFRIRCRAVKVVRFTSGGRQGRKSAVYHTQGEIRETRRGTKAPASCLRSSRQSSCLTIIFRTRIPFCPDSAKLGPSPFSGSVGRRGRCVLWKDKALQRREGGIVSGFGGARWKHGRPRRGGEEEGSSPEDSPVSRKAGRNVRA